MIKKEGDAVSRVNNEKISMNVVTGFQESKTTSGTEFITFAAASDNPFAAIKAFSDSVVDFIEKEKSTGKGNLCIRRQPEIEKTDDGDFLISTRIACE